MLNTSVTFIMWLGDTQWVSYLIADNWLICRLCAQCMISNNNINSGSLRRCVCHYFLQNNVLLTSIIRFSFSDIPNFQGHGKCYELWPSFQQITLTSILIFQDITKLHPIIVSYCVVANLVYLICLLYQISDRNCLQHNSRYINYQ